MAYRYFPRAMGQLVTSCQGENPPFVFRCGEGYLADLSSNNFPIDCKRDCTKSAKFAISGNETHYIECVFNGRGWQEETKPCLRNYYFNAEAKRCDPKSNTPNPCDAACQNCKNACGTTCSSPTFILECNADCASVCEDGCLVNTEVTTCKGTCTAAAVTTCESVCDVQCTANCTTDTTLKNVIESICDEDASKCEALCSDDPCKAACLETQSTCTSKYLGICEKPCTENCNPGCTIAKCEEKCEKICTDGCSKDPDVTSCRTTNCNSEFCKTKCEGDCLTS